MIDLKSNMRYLGQVHFATLMFGLAGIIGKYVAAPAIIVTLGRVLFSSLFLVLVIVTTRRTIKIKTRPDYLWLGLSGLVLAIHWTSFMQSIQISSVAIGTITFSTFPLFVTFLEPVLFHEQLHGKDVILALAMLAGVFVLVPYGSLDGEIVAGILWGMVSSFTYAILSLLNRKLAHQYHSTVVCFYEQSVATIILLPSLLLVPFEFVTNEFYLIVVLGVVCTAVAHSLFVASLKKIRAQTAGIVSSMESVYGIILAFLLLGQAPSLNELMGGAVILGVTLMASLSARQQQPSKDDQTLTATR